ncbi:hypothetical protein MMAG44476_39185 [Mycolicibacterium mageritense DSM 44476 = CIP 104973]|jgi:transcriptional regulator with XRE-family HTH domain|uniref:Helix-turn-helix family protein n=2 Tax=Mycolicibacterium TaxID=1866885 RepID=A0A100WCE7_MYCCR|nr:MULTISPECIES: helix-turn-helix transcriptional regulator [Mycolicibacterium]MCC9184595.1 helix-turn-helix domain-containing protein [Mycolicibacterium mageritense]MCV7212700.1 helix-turn-helix transcriptional regulator [Mycolicibacterium canariasense]ORV09793.1 hypothetical protein AWB94_08840 [Mycolicibacterium canariasense]CDO25798.1 putative transcriptional regulator [Mycolicibacterium mageritense DSM 44476 = CIP 104973]BBX37537.1 hypothetical protein MMAGJ_68190 [Mycolicibacterium mager
MGDNTNGTIAEPLRYSSTVTDVAIGAAIRRRRTGARMQLDKLADKAGVNLKVMSRIELGQRPCRVPEMVSIARALRLSPQTLIKEATEIQAAGAAASQAS